MYYRSVLEHGENMRRGIAATALLTTKRLMAARYSAYFRSVELDCTKSENTAVRWAEQNYDVVMEINHALVTFCQAYYYEGMIPCPDSASPNFGDSLDELLVRLLNAQNALGDTSRSSSATIEVDITVCSMEISTACFDYSGSFLDLILGRPFNELVL